MCFGQTQKLTTCERWAMLICMREFDGGKFDYDAFEFEDPE